MMSGAAQPAASASWRHDGGGRAQRPVHDLRGVIEALGWSERDGGTTAGAASGGNVQSRARIRACWRRVTIEWGIRLAHWLGQLAPSHASRKLELRGDVFVRRIGRVPPLLERSAREPWTFTATGALPERHARPRRGRGPGAGARGNRRRADSARRSRCWRRWSFSTCSPTTGAKKSPPTKSRSLIH